MLIKVPKYRFVIRRNGKIDELEVLQIDFEKRQVVVKENTNSRDRSYYDFKAVDGLDLYSELNDDRLNPIYENDIVEYKIDTLLKKKLVIGYIRRMHGGFWVFNLEKEECEPLYHDDAELKVLGNIYKDSYLLGNHNAGPYERKLLEAGYRLETIEKIVKAYEDANVTREEICEEEINSWSN